jgi:hypothetical protein
MNTELWKILNGGNVTLTKLHGVESILKSHQLLGYSRISLKVHYCLYKILPLVPILSQINLVHTISPCLSKIHFNIIPPTCRSS